MEALNTKVTRLKYKLPLAFLKKDLQFSYWSSFVYIRLSYALEMHWCITY